MKKLQGKIRYGNKGITLIALIITIIIMLIIAGVAISAVTGSNGILSRSKDAVNKYSNASADEEMKLYLMGLEMEENATGSRLADYLKSHIGIDGLEDYQNNGDGTAQIVLNGKKYTLNLSDLTYTYDGAGTGAIRNLKQVLNSNNEDVPGVAMVGAGDIETEDLGWEVLQDNGDTVDLIAINNTNFEVIISGINGYTNGVKALNDICNKLYGSLEINGTKVTSARNVNANDFYDITYSTTKTYNSASKVQPYIAKLDTENNGFSTDQITDYIDPTNTSGLQSSNSQMLNAAATGVKIVSQSRTAKSSASLMYTGNQYWIATRGMGSGYDSNAWKNNGGDTDAHRYETYNLSYTRTDGALSTINLFVIHYTNTSGDNTGLTAALRPVITVPASLVSDKTVGAKVTTDPFYKGKTGAEAHGYVSADSISSLLGTDVKSVTKIDAGLPTAEADMTWTKLTDGGYDTSSGSFDTSKYDYYVADRTTKLQVRLTGAQAYNNGVLALDTICNQIYGGVTSIKLSDGSTKNVTVDSARNAKFEDFWDESNITKNTTNGYGSIWSTDASLASSPSAEMTYKYNRWTPTIYSKENIDPRNPSKGYSDAKITTYNMSSSTAYYNNSSTSLTDENRSSYSAEYRYPSITVMYNVLWGTGANRNTAVSTKTSNSSNYWLSSRCTYEDWIHTLFRLRAVSGSGSLGTKGVFESNSNVGSSCSGLRPVLVVKKQ